MLFRSHRPHDGRGHLCCASTRAFSIYSSTLTTLGTKKDSRRTSCSGSAVSWLRVLSPVRRRPHILRLRRTGVEDRLLRPWSLFHAIINIMTSFFLCSQIVGIAFLPVLYFQANLPSQLTIVAAEGLMVRPFTSTSEHVDST